MMKFGFTEELGDNSFYAGNFAFDSAPKAVLLNSRQSKMPAGSDHWIINTIKAARQAASNNWIVLTGIGMNTWELAVWACGRENGRQVIIVPLKAGDDYRENINQISHNFGLESEKTGWLFFRAAEKARSQKIDWPERDKIAIGMADFILPVSIRQGGNLENLIARYSREKGKLVIKDFETGYAVKKHERVLGSEPFDVTVPRKKWDYVTHWTRTCYGPWPKESAGLFYKRLADSGSRYPNNSLATLKNILHNGVIYGSSGNLRGDLTGVAFSSLHPVDIVPLMRWRKRHVRWNFEPYGIAISRRAAIAAGIVPVIYGSPKIYEALIESDKPYFQNEGEVGAWREEKEWRFIGDFPLAGIDPGDMRIIVYRPEETGALEDVGKSIIISMT